MLFSPLYFLFVGPPLILAMIASARVKSTFHKFDRVATSSRMTGAQAAAAVARAGGATVRIERARGFLTDHYDPRSKTLRLSEAVYDGQSVSAVAVAAHEAGHAIQDVRGYAWLRFRSNMVPATQFGSQAWIWIFLLGAITAFEPLMVVGVVLLGLTVVFQLVTLPVEFDASNRAKAVLTESGITVTDQERDGVASVLNAAAMTYVAGALTALMTLLYYVMLLMGNRD
jgi:Zn-dependent membrane protease YugP